MLACTKLYCMNFRKKTNFQGANLFYNSISIKNTKFMSVQLYSWTTGQNPGMLYLYLKGEEDASHVEGYKQKFNIHESQRIANDVYFKLLTLNLLLPSSHVT